MKNSVKLVSISKPVTPECDTAEDLIAYCARVSNPANQANHDTAAKLLKFLARNGHWSPFEMVHVTMEIQCTRDIGRQILRHRSFSFQEFSQRYASVKLLDDDLFSFREARTQDLKNRQNSNVTDDFELIKEFEDIQRRSQETAKQDYQRLLDIGIAKEQARCILPEGMTMSRMYMSGTVRSWIHYCGLRRGNGTQKEHQLLADQCWDVILNEFPSLTEVLD